MPDQSRAGPGGGAAPERPVGRRKVLIASGIGVFVEYFDFATYGFLATTLAHVFFPSTNATVALLQTFGVYAVSYVVRPLGGLVFGHFGDKVGRTRTMAFAVVLMSLGTCLVGLLPGYATLGIAAPLLLVLFRLVQGFSAGGESYGAAVLLTEYAPPQRRGLFASVMPANSSLGLVSSALVSFLLSATLPAAVFAAWGWRIPFLLAAPLGLIGLYLRLRLGETPIFREVKNASSVARAPVLRTLRRHYRQIFTVFGFAISAAIAPIFLTVYIVNYLTAKLHFSPAAALLADAVAIVVMFVCQPICGIISDRVGRKPVLIAGLAGLALLSVPSLLIIEQGSLLAAVLGMCLLAPLGAAVTVILAVVSAEVFPTKVRYTGSAISSNLSTTLFGGTAPFVATFLVAVTGSALAPGFYVSAMSVVSLVVAVFALRETNGDSLVRDQDLQPEGRSPLRADVITDAT
jgi:MHS family proline/betaine transporter-like MFS transporter